MMVKSQQNGCELETRPGASRILSAFVQMCRSLDALAVFGFPVE